MECMAKTTTDLLDFDICTGYRPIPLMEIRRMFNTIERCHPVRVFLLFELCGGCRLGSLAQIKVNNISGNICSYYENKNAAYRKFYIPQLMLAEIKEYINNNWLANGRLWNKDYKAIERYFNDKIRPAIGGAWLEWDQEFKSRSAVRERRKYILRGIRTTIGTVAYSYYLPVYGESVALARVCSWLGHESKNMSADHYIKQMHKIGLEKWPKLPMLQLLDYIVYNDYQTHIKEYTRDCKLLEF